MNGDAHVLIALTGHGFGHAAQACVVARALRRRLPGLRLTLRSRIPRPVLAELFGEPFDLDAEPADPGLVMRSPFDVDAEASADAYAVFHEGWGGRVRAEARRLRDLAPDILLSDVPYLPIAAAADAGIPAYALCSLNWADLYRHYCGHRPEAGRIHAEILSSYRAAEAFLIAEPGMPMGDLGNRRAIGPCARIGADRRHEIRRRLGLEPETRLILVAMGGIDWRADLAGWPRFTNAHLLVHAADVPAVSGMSAFEDLDAPMIDVLRASDAVVTKIGYGLLTEAACNGTALLYVGRDDWPEAPYGYAWAETHLRAERIERDDLAAGSFGSALERVMARRPLPVPLPTGGDEAADILAKCLADS